MIIILVFESSLFSQKINSIGFKKFDNSPLVSETRGAFVF